MICKLSTIFKYIDNHDKKRNSCYGILVLPKIKRKKNKSLIALICKMLILPFILGDYYKKPSLNQ